MLRVEHVELASIMKKIKIRLTKDKECLTEELVLEKND